MKHVKCFSTSNNYIFRVKHIYLPAGALFSACSVKKFFPMTFHRARFLVNCTLLSSYFLWFYNVCEAVNKNTSHTVLFFFKITFTSRGSPSHGSSLGRKCYPELWRQALWVKKTETNRERSSHVNRAVVTVIKIRKETQTRTQTWTFELKWRRSELNSFLYATRKSWRKWQFLCPRYNQVLFNCGKHYEHAHTPPSCTAVASVLL